MKTILKQILDKYLNGREIAVWGTPTRRLLRELQPYKYHIADAADREKHYVVAVTGDDMDDFLSDAQGGPFEDIADCYDYSDVGHELPFEWEYYGAKIGKQTYFGDGVADACQNGYIKSIGNYTSINGTAMVHVDHQHNMTFVSDDIEKFFTEENKVKFAARMLADAKLPPAPNKSHKVTIGNDVWLGAYSFINCSKVKSIGDGAVIGSGAVVLRDVPPYAVMSGVPARILRYRYPPEMIKALLRVKWWDWSAEEINANIGALLDPGAFMARFGKI